jgi:spermidine/putrescine transport system ATP-binding protein
VNENSLILENVAHRMGTFSLQISRLKVNPGEVLAIMGDNGAGKSTLLALLAGFIRPQQGRVSWAGKDIRDIFGPGRAIRTVSQDLGLFPGYTARQQIALGSIRRPGASSVETVAVALGVDTVLDRRVELLSGGQKQRVAIARAIVSRPQLLLLDEPFAAVDEDGRASLWTNMRALLNRVSAVVITHDSDWVMRSAQHVAILRGGQLEQVGTPAMTYSNPLSLYAARCLGRCSSLTLNGSEFLLRPDSIEIEPTATTAFSARATVQWIRPLGMAEEVGAVHDGREVIIRRTFSTPDVNAGDNIAIGWNLGAGVTQLS